MPRWKARYSSRVIGGRAAASTAFAPAAPSASRSTTIAARALAGTRDASGLFTIPESAAGARAGGQRPVPLLVRAQAPPPRRAAHVGLEPPLARDHVPLRAAVGDD